MKNEVSYYMNKTLFVSATNTDIGKTYACETFLRYFAKNGLKVGYFKPCETGVENYPLDGTKMLSLVKELNSDFDFAINDIVPYQFKLPAAPYIAKKNTIIDFKLLKQKIKELKSKCDVLIIEGAGGLMVPVEKDIFIIDLIEIFNCDETFLIAPSKLGCINDILLSSSALNNRNINFSLFVNLYKDLDSFDEVSKPFLDEYINYKFLHDYK